MTQMSEAGRLNEISGGTRWLGRRAKPFLCAIAAFTLWAVSHQAGAAEGEAQAVIDDVEAYLNGITTVRAKFVQLVPDGGISEGTIYIHRPERMRVEYEPPAQIRLVAADGWVTFFDLELGQISQTQTRSTPAHILLRKDIRLGGDVTVTEVARPEGLVQIGLTQTDNPGEGKLTLIFTDDPLRLARWVVRDPQGLETVVTLLDAEIGIDLDPALFSAPSPFPDSRGH